MKSAINKAISLLLALLLVIQLMPVQAMAANSGQLSSGTISTEPAEAPEILLYEHSMR